MDHDSTNACNGNTTEQAVPMEEQINKCNNKPHSANWQALYKKRCQLPIFEYKEKFLRLLEENQTIVLVGETGSGKTTQIPQWCLEFCRNRPNERNNSQKQCVACTQPRRVAAMSVAARVAEEMNVKLGDDVGYSVRFEACTSFKTVLKYLTDGMLLREAMLDEYLNQYSIIILDEAHERTLQTEILLGVLKRILEERSKNLGLSQIKVIVMSATMNVKLFKKFFNAPLLVIKGRQYLVQDMFAEFHQSDYATSALVSVFQIHRTSDEEGDILVFCTGQDEIESLINLCRRALKQAPESMQSLTPLPLYASLPAAHQIRVFTTDNQNNSRVVENGTPKIIHRRVIFATNVAETSITIPNIRYVVDTGKIKYRYYCPRTGLESLKVITISKAQAKQRSGRAGRVSSGTCYRLYTSQEYETMDDYLAPEIQRCNLDNVIFQMISIGIRNIRGFDFLEPPEEIRIISALNNLKDLKAIKIVEPAIFNGITISNGIQNHKSNNLSSTPPTSSSVPNDISTQLFTLTALGKKLSTFPIDPRMGRIILAAEELGCLDEAVTIVALLYVDTLFFIPSNKQEQANTVLEKFRTNEGDLVMYLKVYKSFKKSLTLNRTTIKSWCNEHFIHRKNLRLAIDVRKQIANLCNTIGLKSSTCGQNTEKLRRALTYGLFNNVAMMRNGKYQSQSKNDIHIHPSSCLFKARPECVIYTEIVETSKCYMRKLTTIDKSWIVAALGGANDGQ